MQIPQIRMQSQFAKIEIETIPARQSIQQRNAEIRIEQPRADMRMRTIPGRLTIDQTQAWEDMNIKSAFKSIRENAAKGQQAVMEGIAQLAQEGQEMLNIHTGQNAFVEQAKRHAFPPPPEMNITWIPSVGSVKINYEPGRTDIDFHARKPIIEAKTRKPIVSYEPGDVKVDLKQRNQLIIDLVK